LAREDWGAKPRIALVYGLGVCSLDSGIRARWLERVFAGLERDGRVKAVVFRVDSPGGDPLASDLVAEALRKCSRRKPVIVTQGQVAASGGYWLSMYADSILAGPTTVTGSIGVIGGWLYDQGLSAKLGLSSDLAARGRHAGYDAGVQLPLLGVRIPAHRLSPEEQSRVEGYMAELYKRFTAAVAQSRGLTPSAVDSLAEGRIYSGRDGLGNGLVDGLGGMLLAIDVAASKAGLKAGVNYEIVEYPARAGWFELPWHVPGVLASSPASEWDDLLNLMARANGTPMTLLLPGSYPECEP
jgi:protease-4